MHVYSLPPELLQTLTLRNLINEPVHETKPITQTSTTTTGSKTCAACLGVAFTDVDEQRAHFRSDWHRYNVKTKLNGGESVAEQDFGKMVDSV